MPFDQAQREFVGRRVGVEGITPYPPAPQKFGLSLVLMEIWLFRITGARGSNFCPIRAPGNLNPGLLHTQHGWGFFFSLISKYRTCYHIFI